MQLGHALVIAAEKRGEVLRQVFFVELGQGADNAEIQRHIPTESGRCHTDLDISRVHVGVKKTIAKHLGKENSDAVTRQLRDVHARLPQSVHMADRQTVHAFHDNHFAGAVIPDHFRD